ncbi:MULTISPECIES: PID-CTERM protein-sorting domain-containing protein [Flavobacteriaceae]|jgi:hypothetical protein|uniref:Uncharacterized protein n=2 Tax=Flavobacteriaceae TaxID=49546 RepID=A0ABN1JDL4_9FLAO|nr:MULTISPECIES: hypothetical protein [Meridianimaribacter]RYH76266.1 hypothetical protein EVU94_04715 [Flavobacteriaceae bacterium 144Ye]TBV28344.1 hypothetical protein DMZ43_04705 [Meridianimaribacter sp. CL38]TDY13520.1 hypothetical protein A8975_0111 [Meridianimaribacter flavus]
MGIQNRKILASILFVLISFVCNAQVDGTPPPPIPPPPPGLPIDGGIAFLVAIGLFYGIKKKIK